MVYGKRIMNIIEKWRKRLKNNDGDYFKDHGVVKDVSLFSALLKANHVEVFDDGALEVALYKYLQVLMIMCTVSDDERDKVLADNFLPVPFMLEEISKGHIRFDEMLAVERNYKKWQKTNLDKLWDAGVADTRTILGDCPPSHKKMVEDVLSYYSTPIVAFCCITGMKTSDYCFRKELSLLLEYVIESHFPERQSDDETIEHYIESMIIVSSFRNEKVA